ncbi:MAG: hypothetical protein LBR73_09950 [Oscillospiraceae bacterium]|jgi:hypothetical protein|nr:hypothetical protein [Oscillospiraceae bacterium]
MKKSPWKRILSVALVLALAVTVLCLPATAADVREEDCTVYPTIFIRGGAHALNMLDENGVAVRYDDYIAAGNTLPEGAFEDGGNIEYFDVGDLMEMIPLGEIMDAVSALDFAKLSEIVADIFPKAMAEILCDKNGDPIGPWGEDYAIEWDANNPGYLIYEYRGMNIYKTAFNNDWRLSPIENAAKLDETIQEIKDTMGVDKVNIDAISFGGSTLAAYLDIYGRENDFEDVASVVFNQTLSNGTAFMGNIANRSRVDISADALSQMTILPLFGLTSSIKDMLNPWLSLLYEPGILTALLKLVELIADPLLDDLYFKGLLPSMFQMPGFWAEMSPSDARGGIQYLFNSCEAKANGIVGSEYTGLIEKIMDYVAIQERAKETIQLASEKCKVGILSGYGFSSAPFGVDTYAQSDTFVEVPSSSFGATAALPGETLGWFYTQKAHTDKNFISPDKVIDASTCVLPENTWFFKNLPHSEEWEFDGWYMWFLRTPNPTVFSSSDYPQFQEFVGKIKLDNDSDGTQTEMKVFTDVAAFVPTVWDYINDIFKFLMKVYRWIVTLPFCWI